jgi:hypothetical protein
MGAVNGLTVYVPPAYTRLSIPGVPAILDPESAQKLKEADVVLGVVGAGLTESCRQELSAGMGLRKNMIVMSDPTFAPLLRPSFGPSLVVIDPANPDQAESELSSISEPSTPGIMRRRPSWLWGLSRSACLSSPLRIKADSHAGIPLSHRQFLRRRA